MILDSIDRNILQILQNQGRIKMKHLGEYVHLSSPAVIERVRRLQDEEIILGYTVDLSLKALGFTIEADILVLLRDMYRKKDFVEHIQTEAAVYDAYETMGRSDALLRVACQNMDELLALVRRLQEFGHTETYLHMSHYKDNKLLIPPHTNG